MPSPIKRKYPKEMEEAIWTLLLARVRPAEILRRIREGDAGLARAYPMPRATYFDYQRKLKLERGDPRDHVEPGDETLTGEAIERRLLAIANRETRKLEQKVRANKPLDQADLNRADKVAGIVSRLRKQTAPTGKAKAGKQGGIQDGSPRRLADLASTNGTAPDRSNGIPTQGEPSPSPLLPS